MSVVVFPWYLFGKKKKPEVLTNELLKTIHEEIRDSIVNMKKKCATNAQINEHIDRVNTMMRNKWGNRWKDYPNYLNHYEKET